MKKYWVLPAIGAVAIGTTLLLVFSKDKAGDSSQTASSGAEIPANPVATNANTKINGNGKPTNMKNEGSKQEETLEDIKKMYKPEWEKVNQLADQRLAELIAQAEKEFKAKKESNQDVSRLEGKYLAIYNDYEERTKTQVDSIISSMQKEVRAKELSNNIGDEYFELYRIQKEKRTEKVVSELKKLS